MVGDKRPVLLVEGRDDREVVYQLCNHYGIDNRSLFIVEEKRGYEQLRDDLRVRPKTGVPIIGVVVDGNSDPTARWGSLTDTLRACGYRALPAAPSPGGTILAAPPAGRSRIGIWMMPDNRLAGMLEDFLLTLANEEDPLLARAEAAVAAIPREERRFADSHRAKALIHTWLAWQEIPGTPLGLALTRRYLDPDGPTAARFMDWLRKLFSPA